MTTGARAPRILHPPPGPRSRALAADLARHEAPGINTLGSDPASEAPILWEEAVGANVRDVDGNLYVDLTSGFGVAAVGHRHPAVVAAIRRQSGRLLHALGDVHAHPLRVALASRLSALAASRVARGPRSTPPFITPASSASDADPLVFFATSGSEAIEIALKTALAYTGRPGIVTFSPSYHGLTLGALSATSRPEFRQPFLPYLHDHVRRLPYGCPPADLLAALSSSSDSGSVGSGTIGVTGVTGVTGVIGALGDQASALASGPAGAVLVEPIVGREGVLLPPAGWLSSVARLCREAGALLIVDEIFTGFGRTGDLFAIEAEEVTADLLCCGKALGGGLPLAAVVGRRELFEVWRTPGEALHTSTFVANPLACAAALTVLDLLAGERLPARASRLGAGVGERLATWSRRFPAVVATRGRGLLWGVELRSRDAAAAWVQAALRRGILLLAGGPQGRVAQIVPPLTIAEPLLELALDLLEQALAESAAASSPAMHRA